LRHFRTKTAGRLFRGVGPVRKVSYTNNFLPDCRSLREEQFEHRVSKSRLSSPNAPGNHLKFTIKVRRGDFRLSELPSARHSERGKSKHAHPATPLCSSTRKTMTTGKNPYYERASVSGTGTVGLSRPEGAEGSLRSSLGVAGLTRSCSYVLIRKLRRTAMAVCCLLRSKLKTVHG